MRWQTDAALHRVQSAAIGCLAATVVCAVEPATCSDAATYFPLARAMADAPEASDSHAANGLHVLYEVGMPTVALGYADTVLQARTTLANELLARPAALPALAAALQPERDIQAALSAMHVLLMTTRVSPPLCAMCAQAGLLASLLTARRSVNGALALAAASAIVDGCIRHAARGGGPQGPSTAGCDPQACQAVADMLLVRMWLP